MYQPPQDPFHTTTMTPASAQIHHGDVPGHPQMPQVPGEPPKKRNKGLIITAIVLGVVLVLCGVGGVGAFLLLRNNEGRGAETAKIAADDFLTAVYKDHNGTAAEKLVCGEARDRKAIDKKIEEVKSQKAKLKGPSITWEVPTIENETAEKADATVTIKLTTSDEKLSQQTLKLGLVKHEGWFVCEVQEQKK
jgi:flagellar basal body-associated protein FliL